MPATASTAGSISYSTFANASAKGPRLFLFLLAAGDQLLLTSKLLQKGTSGGALADVAEVP
jgi:hypothetical protein